MTDSLKAWIVTASRGEYSDRVEWNVRGFTDEGRAKAFCDRIGAVAREAYRLDEYPSAEPDAYSDAWRDRWVSRFQPVWDLDPNDPDCLSWRANELFGFLAPTYSVAPIEIDVDEWQPIETAPREGETRILLTSPEWFEGAVVIGWWSEEYVAGGGWFQSEDSGPVPWGKIEPTHWRPLPKT